MHYLPKTLFIATLAGGSALLCGFQGRSAQDPSRTPVTALSGQRMTNEAEDGLLAFWLVLDNRNAVTLSRMAQQRASDSEVKRFAATMLSDHQQLLEKLRPFAKGHDMTGMDGSTSGINGSGSDGKGRDANGRDVNGRDANGRDANGRDSTDRDGDGRDISGREAQRALPAGSQGSGAYPNAALLQELGDQCLSSTQAELEQKQGAQFDRCFMGTAVAAHMHANDMLTVFQRHASGDLKNVMVETQRSVQAHLEEAKTILAKLESKDMRVATPTREPK